MNQEPFYVGIDVSKSRTGCGRSTRRRRMEHGLRRSWVRDLASRLQSLGPAAVVLEATGGLEVPLVSMTAYDDQCPGRSAAPGTSPDR